MQICSTSSQRPNWPAYTAASIAVIGVALLIIGALGALKVFPLNSLSPHLADKHFFIAGGTLFAGAAFALFLHYTCCCYPQKKIKKDPESKPLKVKTSPTTESTSAPTKTRVKKTKKQIASGPSNSPPLSQSVEEPVAPLPLKKKKARIELTVPHPDPEPSLEVKMTQSEIESALATFNNEKNKTELTPILSQLPKDQAEAIIRLFADKTETLPEEIIAGALSKIPDSMIDKTQVASALQRIPTEESKIFTDTFNKIGKKSTKPPGQESHITMEYGASEKRKKANPKLESDPFA